MTTKSPEYQLFPPELLKFFLLLIVFFLLVGCSTSGQEIPQYEAHDCDSVTTFQQYQSHEIPTMICANETVFITFDEARLDGKTVVIINDIDDPNWQIEPIPNNIMKLFNETIFQKLVIVVYRADEDASSTNPGASFDQENETITIYLEVTDYALEQLKQEQFGISTKIPGKYTLNSVPSSF